MQTNFSASYSVVKLSPHDFFITHLFLLILNKKIPVRLAPHWNSM